MFFICDLIDYYLNPKYVVMKGIGIDNRAIMFLGVTSWRGKDGYGNKVIKFKNQKYEYYYNKIYIRIWTIKQLKHWRKMIGVDTRCLEKRKGKWCRLEKPDC